MKRRDELADLVDKAKFVKEVLGEFPQPSDDELRAEEAVANYEASCEAYDRLICGKDGIPKTSQQRHLINKHAQETRDMVICECRITLEDFKKAMKQLRMRKKT